VLTSQKQGECDSDVEEFDGITYYRTNCQGSGLLNRLQKYPYIGEVFSMRILYKRIVEVAKIEKVDLIHAHSPSLNGIPARIAAKKLGIPMVYEIRAFWEDAAVDHGTATDKSLRYRITKWLETKLVKNTNSVVTICNGLKNDLIERGVDSSKIFVIPNGIDTGRFIPRPKNYTLIEKYGLEKNVVLGFIGSFYKYEGLEDLIKAFVQIHRQRPETKLLLIGGGTEESRLHSLIPSDINDQIVFTGRVPHESILDYYSIIDIFVYPRRKIRLTELVTPLKPLEALAMHKFVVGSDVGGIKELLEGDNSGLLFRAGDIEDLVSKVVTVIDRVGEDDKTRDNGDDKFLYDRDWEKIVKGYNEVYNN
jgi:glycogen(starch) synthase